MKSLQLFSISKMLPLRSFDCQVFAVRGVGEGARMVRVVGSSVKVSLETQPHPLSPNGYFMCEIEDSEVVFQLTLLLILRSKKHTSNNEHIPRSCLIQ
jgi:hypothetical protein